MYPTNGGIQRGDPEGAGRKAAEIRAWIEEAQAEVDEIVGVGEAASGQVKVEVAADGKVLDVTFGRRSLRLDSKTLAEAVQSAVGDAQRDAVEKVGALMREGLGFDPAEAQAVLARVSETLW